MIFVITAEIIDYLFVNRHDAYAKQTKSGYIKVLSPVTMKLLQDHIDGKQTIGMYQLNNNNEVKWVCFDLDAAEKKKFKKMDSSERENKMSGLLMDALRLKNHIKREYGIDSYIEFSGFKGYHVWIFTLCTPAKSARAFGLQILNETQINCELFPKQDKKAEYGNLVKLPFGTHLESGKQGAFIEDIDFTDIRLSEIPILQANGNLNENTGSRIQPTVGQTEERNQEALNDGIKRNIDFTNNRLSENQSMYPIDTLNNETGSRIQPNGIITGGSSKNMKEPSNTQPMLEDVLLKCRPCFELSYVEKWQLTGDDGDRFRLYSATELIANGATDAQLHEYFKAQLDYDPEITQKKINTRRIFKGNPAKCETIKADCGLLLNNMCDTCNRNRRTQPNPAELSRIQPNENHFIVSNPDTFGVLKSKYPDSKVIEIDKDKSIYHIAGDDFIKLALDLKIIESAKDDMKAKVLTSPTQLEMHIDDVEVYEDGDNTIYDIVIRKKKIRFTVTEMMDIVKWREKIIHPCKLAISFDLRKTERKDAFHEMITAIVDKAKTVWREGCSVEDEYAQMIISQLQKMLIVEEKEQFRMNPMAILKENNAIWVKSSDMVKICEELHLKIELRKLRVIMKLYLKESSKQIRIGNERLSCWIFKDDVFEF